MTAAIFTIAMTAAQFTIAMTAALFTSIHTYINNLPFEDLISITSSHTSHLIAYITIIIFTDNHTLPNEYTYYSELTNSKNFISAQVKRTFLIIMVLTPMFGFSGSLSAIDIIQYTPYINVKSMSVCKFTATNYDTSSFMASLEISGMPRGCTYHDKRTRLSSPS
ncbi:hypothetical protein PanWU01x14_310950 [Parasponia andersonii]|uniref:Uncharacterized protein n=1 Tax=Parasponia andersonii TaxID=3476 RepID=A0A2P5AQB4_PARAD|nr:hypothetical protein PanWU01x14_310950 [Parasponia andersonii]